MKKLIIIFVSLFYTINIQSLTLRIVNTMKDKDLTIFRPNAKSFTLKPGISEDIKDFSREELPYGIANKGSIGIPKEAGKIPLNDAMANPYPNGVSIIEVSKSLLGGINFKTYLRDSFLAIKLNLKDINEWTKVLDIPKNASPEEIVASAYHLAGGNINHFLQNMNYKQDLEKIAVKLESAWKNAQRPIWMKIQGAINTLKNRAIN